LRIQKRGIKRLDGVLRWNDLPNHVTVCEKVMDEWHSVDRAFDVRKVTEMLKKIGFVTAAAAAGAMMMGGLASAESSSLPGLGSNDEGGNGQVGLLNLNNTDLLHNVNANVGVCDNNINVLGVQVPIEDALNGVGIPVLSPGEHDAEGATPENCASSALVNGGSVQDN
jgi:hypothetical protein